MEDLERYLEDMVEPSVSDFESNPSSRRHASSPASSLLMLLTMLNTRGVQASEETGSENRRRIDFDLVDQVAHAFKHVRSSLEQSKVIARLPFFWDGAVWDDDTKWIDKPVVTLDGDVEVDLLVSVKKSVALLREINDLAPGD